MSIVAEVLEAEARIRAHTLETPLLRSHYLSVQTGANVYLKLESEQHTGSFKARGALNKLLALTDEERAAGVVTSSTGNHGQAVARALALTGVTGAVFLPKNAEATKVEAIKQYGARIEFHGDRIIDTEVYVEELAREKGLTLVSAYNDPLVIGGQGTIAIELLRQLSRIDDVFVTIGGGGLVAGIAAYLKDRNPETRVVGCLPENSPAMYECIEAGRVVTVKDEPTLADGSAGNILDGAITFDLCRDLIHDYRLVSEDEIEDAIRLMVDVHHKIIEGAAGVAIASVLKRGQALAGRNVVVIVCGSNIATQKLTTILARRRD